jgi:lipid II:glycine glycyltransferase (peptidoglycan interpeptide bridge formation enzyme)
MQPEHTWVLDITKDEETLLAEMSMRCRYNVRLAEKSGITVTSSVGLDEDKLDNFYKLYSITGKRHGISFRNRTYFASLLEILGQNDKAYVYNATLDKDGIKTVLSAGILIYSGNKAIYIFGASSNEHRNLKAPNLLVWQMILDAQRHGATEFDFYGIAPDDNPKHPWAGITSFKKQFGGRQVDIVGSYDLVFKPLEYKAFKVAEKMRRRKQ